MTFQTFLLVTGFIFRELYISVSQIAFAFAAGLAVQWIALRLLKLKDVGYKSALITCFGVCLILRAENLWVHPLAAAIAQASKFVIRYRGKHIYNPSNFGVVIALLALPGAWVARAQWGYSFLMAAWCIALGSYVVLRANRNDISWTFLSFYLGAVALRTLFHGVSWEAFTLQINGALLIFSFFMISDPMAIPNRRNGRILFAALVAGLAYLLQYVYYIPHAKFWMPEGMKLTTGAMASMYGPYALLVALFLLSPLVPLLDRLWEGNKFQWSRPAAA